MGKPNVKALREALHSRASQGWADLGKNHLWQRMIKNVLAIELVVIICLIPASLQVLGKAAYLGPIVAIFAHPGRRFGALVESILLVLVFTFVGLAWALLGIYLGSLVYDKNEPASYAIRGIFILILVIFHGYYRSSAPRLFLGMVFLVLSSFVTLLGTNHKVTSLSMTGVLYPILVACGISLVVNLSVFPESNASFLGQASIETLNDVAQTMREAEKYFVQMSGLPSKEHVTADGNEDDRHVKALVDSPGPSTAVPEKPGPGFGSLHWPPWSRKGTAEPQQASPAPQPTGEVKLTDLMEKKAMLRASLATSEATQRECVFELALSCLPPSDMELISTDAMKRLVDNTIALIGACESKYALLSTEDDQKATSHDAGPNAESPRRVSISDNEPSRSDTPASDGESPMARGKASGSRSRRRRNRERTASLAEEELEMIKPQREIEAGDVKLLRFLVRKISAPLEALQQSIDRSVEVVTSCVAFAYVGPTTPLVRLSTDLLEDVPRLPSGTKTPRGIIVEELDLHVDTLSHALVEFDKSSAAALEDAAMVHELERRQVDILPREEIFLIASFILVLRQAATQTLRMLRHSRRLVERRAERRGRKRLYLPRVKWRNWMHSGGDEGDRHPKGSREATASDAATSLGKKSQGEDEDEDDANDSDDDDDEYAPHVRGEQTSANLREKTRRGTAEKRKIGPDDKSLPPDLRSTTLRIRGKLADFIDWSKGSDDVLYALKITIAVFLVSFPALVPAWNSWYSLNRGIWAAFQLIYVFDVVLGSTIRIFILRFVGTMFGCLWGWGAYESRHGDRITCAILICIGLIPCVYIQLNTKHIKVGQVAMVSLTVVSLATELGTVPGSGTENFIKRLCAFYIGSLTALILQVVIFPVKARTRLVRSLANSIKHISEMEACIAFGIESRCNISAERWIISKKYQRASAKTNDCLAAADFFLSNCKSEPRIKGSFDGLFLIYTEILFVLHQISDKMDNMLRLRKAYGSSVLEEFNVQIYAYRRNVAGAISLTLFAVHEALLTKLPLPQFLPSARLAHLRMVNRVREVVKQTSQAKDRDQLAVYNAAHRVVVRQKFMAWNASSAAQAEIVEYLEELVELTKLLVGANEFRSGILTRPTYQDFKQGSRKDDVKPVPMEKLPSMSKSAPSKMATDGKQDEVDHGLPEALKRIQSRTTDAKVEREIKPSVSRSS